MGQPDFLVGYYPRRNLSYSVSRGFAAYRFGFGRTSGTITNDIAAAEDLKAKAQDAEAAYDKALIDARAEAGRIVAETKAGIQADLDKAIATADTKIATKAAEGEKVIAEIRAGALDNVKVVAKDTAKEIVAAMGGKADAKSITAAVTARMKG